MSEESKKIKLTDEQTEKVSGGTVIQITDRTQMECSSCGYSTMWDGNYEGKVLDCPKCKKHTFSGVSGW